MRPALILTLFAAASLACLPTDGNAQPVTGSPPSAETASDNVGQNAEQTDKAEPTPQERAEARRVARLEREKEEERLRQERARLCVIKPVMTDAEIAQCKEVWR